MASLTLLEVLADVPDPRSRHGRRHPLTAILALTVLAMLRGCKGPTAISQFGRDHGTALAHALGFLRGKTPAPSCLSDLFRTLDPVAFEAALSRWIAARVPPPAEGVPKPPVSLDGKTLRGSRDGETPGQHLVSAYAHEQEAVLAQIKVDAKTNEHKAALELLGILPVRGRVILGDAMFCQRDLCATITERGGDYVFTVKGNQQGLETDIAAGFGFEAGARSIAAAFSPGPVAVPARAVAPDRGEGTRAGGEADVADDHNPDATPEVAGPGAGVRGHARADGEREDDGGGGVRDDKPQARGGRRFASVGIGA